MKRMPTLLVALFLVVSLTFALFYFIVPASTPWLHETCSQAAISLAALAILSLLVFVDVPTPKWLCQKFVAPSVIRGIALLGSTVGTILFAIFAYITATSHNNSVSREALVAFY